jgi:hypothetical protein
VVCKKKKKRQHPSQYQSYVGEGETNRSA